MTNKRSAEMMMKKSNLSKPTCFRRAMEDPFGKEQIETYKEELQSNGVATASEKINAHLAERDRVPLNTGITGESGSGQSKA
ncbi:hypothetical protein F7725_006336 [Dissostichus mawsoni]|uniref:Uncharacterized protein n=1 Tax=Dissostichus mawsoni TaxID=36200 RepID=A0A7J5XTL5_DISMA|nr:hypothetical protein F7725_006336 [Dissostichus mawsoni]